MDRHIFNICTYYVFLTHIYIYICHRCFIWRSINKANKGNNCGSNGGNNGKNPSTGSAGRVRKDRCACTQTPKDSWLMWANGAAAWLPPWNFMNPCSPSLSCLTCLHDIFSAELTLLKRNPNEKIMKHDLTLEICQLVFSVADRAACFQPYHRASRSRVISWWLWGWRSDCHCPVIPWCGWSASSSAGKNIPTPWKQLLKVPWWNFRAIWQTPHDTCAYLGQKST